MNKFKTISGRDGSKTVYRKGSKSDKSIKDTVKFYEKGPGKGLDKKFLESTAAAYETGRLKRRAARKKEVDNLYGGKR